MGELKLLLQILNEKDEQSTIYDWSFEKGQT